MDEAPEVRLRDERVLLGLEKRRSREADQHHVLAHDPLHRLVEDAALRPVALVHEDEHIALRLESRRKPIRDLLQVELGTALQLDALLLARRRITRHAELVDERGDEPVLRVVERGDEVVSARRPVRRLARVLESVRDLFVELVAIRDDDDPRIRPMLLDPLGKPHHRERLAAPLRVPDDAGLLLLDPRLRRLKAEVLRRTHHLLHARVEHNAVVDEREEPLGIEELHDGTIQEVLDPLRTVLRLGARRTARLLPREPVLLRCPRRPVLEALRLASRHQKLRGRKEMRNLAVLLVAPVLADAVRHADRRLLELDDAERNAVDRNDDIGTPMLLGRHELADGHLLGDAEDVVQRTVPVDELHLLGRLARLGRHLHRIAQHLIDRLVGVV